MIQLEGALFESVQYPGVFEDSKTFVDAIPKIAEEEILKRYQAESQHPFFSLEVFLRKYFIFPHSVTSPAARVNTSSIEAYIASLWNTLEREPADEDPDDTLIPLKYPYIVPGGRFREIYYWDTYFTSVGLAVIKRFDIIRDMINNFVYLQETVGLIPNGNRLYYCTRSQPPVLGFLVNLLYVEEGIEAVKPYLAALEKERQFWMDGSDQINETTRAAKRVVRMPNGTLLNRYCDPMTAPRPESYKEDVELTKGLSEDAAKQMYQDIRSAAESGWDFSSRWFADGKTLKTIHTTDIVPIDLNSLLYGLESLLAKYYKEIGNQEKSALYQEFSANRKEAIDRYLWDANRQFYFDYDFKKDQPTDIYSMAGVVPLFVKMSSAEQATAVETLLNDKFLKAGGLVTTLTDSGEQWDSPNGWSPLQWFAVRGLFNYEKQSLALTVIDRWMTKLRAMFTKKKMLLEKYNVCDINGSAHDGEYLVQGGFGWTNGIVLKFLELQQVE